MIDLTYSKVGHVSDEDVDLDNLLNSGSSSSQDGLEVLDARSRLLLDGALHQVTLSITGNLAGTVDGAGGLNGLGL